MRCFKDIEYTLGFKTNSMSSMLEWSANKRKRKKNPRG